MAYLGEVMCKVCGDPIRGHGNKGLQLCNKQFKIERSLIEAAPEQGYEERLKQRRPKRRLNIELGIQLIQTHNDGFVSEHFILHGIFNMFQMRFI